MKQVKEKKIIRGSKYGLIKGKSCLVSLVVFYDVMTGRVEKGRAVNLLCLGFSNILSLSPIIHL